MKLASLFDPARYKTLRLTAIVALNILLGLLQQLLLLRLLGIGSATDALVAAQAVPTVLSAIISTALGKQLIPFFKEHDTREPGLVLSVSLYLMAAILLAVLVLGLSSPWWLAILFAGLGDAVTKQVIPLSHILLVSMLPSMLAMVLTGYWQSYRSFLRVELAALAASVCGLLLLAPAVEHAGALGAAQVILAKTVINAVLLLWGLGSYRIGRLSPETSKALRSGLRLALSAATLFKMGPLVDRALAAYAGPGAIALLNLLQQVYSMVVMLVERVLSARVIANVSEAKDSGLAKVSSWFRRILKEVSVGATLAAVVLIGILPLLVEWLHQGPVAVNISLMAVLFGFYLVGGVIGTLSAGFLYGANLSQLVFRVAIVTFLASVVARVAGIALFGLPGLVIGITLYQILNAVFLYRASFAFIARAVKKT